MASAYSKWRRRALYKVAPFLFKKCPADNYHWFWHRLCFCRVGEHIVCEKNPWHGGIYDFKNCREYQFCLRAILNRLLEEVESGSIE